MDVTDRVQFREDADVVAFVEAQGLNPNELARTLFEAEVRRMRAEGYRERIRRLNIRLPRSPEEMIREDRDAR